MPSKYYNESLIFTKWFLKKGMLLLFLIWTAGHYHAFSQIIHLSQYPSFAPVVSNPAWAGVRNEANFLLSYRTQQMNLQTRLSAPYLQITYPILQDNTTHKRLGGLGLGAFQEYSRDNFLVVNGFLASFAYNLPLTREHFLSFGLQGGYFSTRLQLLDSISLPKSELLLRYDPSFSPGLRILSNEVGFPTINSGIIFYKEAEEKHRILPYWLAVSLHYLNEPSYSLINQTNRLAVEWLAAGEYQIYRRKGFSFHPTARVLKNYKGATVRLGHILRYIPPLQNSLNTSVFSIGTWLGTDGSLASSLEWKHPKFMVAFSYDASFSEEGLYVKRQELFVKNAFEVHLGWRLVFAPQRRKRRPFTQPFPKKEEKIIIATTTTKVLDTAGKITNEPGSRNRIDSVCKNKGLNVIIREPFRIVAPNKKLSLSEQDKKHFIQGLFVREKENQGFSTDQVIYLNESARLLNKYPDLYLKLLTRSQATTRATQILEEVRNYLILQGVPEDKLIIQVLSEGNTPNNNFLVEFILLRKQI